MNDLNDDIEIFDISTILESELFRDNRIIVISNIVVFIIRYAEIICVNILFNKWTNLYVIAHIVHITQLISSNLLLIVV